MNTVNPSNVHTDLIHNPTTYALFAPGVENPTWEQVTPSFQGLHLLPTPDVQPEDIANAVLFLASDESRYITGLPMTVDAGNFTKVRPSAPINRGRELTGVGGAVTELWGSGRW